MEIYVWDEISGGAGSIKAGPTEQMPNIEVGTKLVPVSFGLADAVPSPSQISDEGELTRGWMTDHVIDLPNGTRIVIDTDHRAHTAVLVTTTED